MEKIPQSQIPHAERDLHHKRWVEEAEKTRAPIFSKKEDAIDRMRFEADRDNADFDLRQHKEFKEWEKSLLPVISHFKERATNPESNRKTLIFMMGGGMKAGYAAGQVLALNDLGITVDKVDIVVGASAGAVVATAYLGGPEQTERGTAMLRGPLSSEEFIKPSIGRLISGDIIKLPLIQSLMEEGPYAVDQESIRSSSAELHYIVTEPVVGEELPVVRILDAKKLDSMTEGITASMTLPHLTGPIPSINGEVFYDGAFSPLPIDEILSRFPDVTDVLILPQNPFKLNEHFEPSLVSKVYSVGLLLTPLGRIAKLQQMEKYLMASQTLRESLERIQSMNHINIGVMWPPDDALYTTNVDGSRATAGIIASYRDTIKRFGGEQPEEFVLKNIENIKAAVVEDVTKTQLAAE